MKPNFALNLTDTSVSMLHRTPQGWVSVGDVPFDSPDLDRALGSLRAAALGLSPSGLTTKVILPPSQVLYLELDAPGPDKATRKREIEKALEGRTPYALADLAYDFQGTGPTVKVAVVARETLAEAEAFATQHRLNPLSFVTIPEASQFGAEPFFGATTLAPGLLPAGEHVTRDQDPVTILARDAAKPDAEKAEATPKADTKDTKADAKPEAKTEGKPSAATAAEKAEVDRKAAADRVRAAEEQARADAEDAERRAASARRIEAEAAEEARRKAATQAEADARASEMAKAEAKRLATEADRARAAQESERVRAEAERSKASLIAAEKARAVSATPEKPEEPAAPGPAPSFASRRQGDTPEVKAPAKGPTPNDAGAADWPLSIATIAAATAKAAGTSNPEGPAKPLTVPSSASAENPAPPLGRVETPPVASATKAPAPARPASGSAVPVKKSAPLGTAGVSGKAAAIPRPRLPANVAASKPVEPGAQTMGSFGAKLQPNRGKPRFLGLMLTLVLLIVLALVAAWSSLYLSRNDSDGAPVNAVVSLPETEPLPATEPDVAALPDAEDPVATAPETATALDDEALSDLPPEEIAALAAPIAEPVAEPEPEPEPAEAPAPPPATPDQTDAARPVVSAGQEQDEIFLAAIDGPAPAFDAVALPKPDRAITDTPPDASGPPPPYGTTYKVDDTGLILATSNAQITPDGVRLISARPVPEPPRRPASLDPAAANTEPASVAAPAAPLTEGFVPDAQATATRPRGRPAALDAEPQQADDDAALTTAGESVRQVSARPRARPASILAQGETARQTAEAASLAATAAAKAEAEAAAESRVVASALAVPISRRPAARPRDFANAVAAAVQEATRIPKAQAEPERRTASNRAKTAEPEDDSEPEVVSSRAAPRIPTHASVAKQATFKNAINLSKTNLIGVYGTNNNRYALIRSSSGRYTKVKVGDRVDGGTVAAITAKEVRYKKGGRMLALSMPKG